MPLSELTEVTRPEKNLCWRGKSAFTFTPSLEPELEWVVLGEGSRDSSGPAAAP